MPAWIAFGVKSSTQRGAWKGGVAGARQTPQPAQREQRDGRMRSVDSCASGAPWHERRTVAGRPRASLRRIRRGACAAGSRSAAISRCRSRGRAGATASTARSRPTSRTCTRPTRSSGCSTRPSRRHRVKELLVLTGERPEVNAEVAARAAPSTGYEDFTAYVVWVCERALERGHAAAHEPRRAGAAATWRGCAR